MRLTNLLKTTALTALLLIGAKVGWGQAILTESFDYTIPGNIGGNTNASGTSNNNWTTHNNSQAGTIDIISGNLSYPGLFASIGNMILLPGNNTTTPRDVNRAFTSTNTTMYCSFLLNVADNTQIKTTTDYFFSFGSTSGASVTVLGARLGIKLGAVSGYVLSIQNTSGGSPTYTDLVQDLAFATTYLVVVKYDRTASPTAATLWVNPVTLGSTEPAGSVSNNSGTATFTTFGSICLRNSANTPKANIDEIRVGTTFADVTPADVTPPTLSSTTPADEATGVAITPSLTLTFNEKIAKGVGNIVIKKLSDDSVIETVDVTSSAVTLSDNTATVTLTSTLGFNTGYYVNIDATALKDLANNNFVGINDNSTWNFTTRIQDVTAPTWTTDYPKVSDINNSDFNLKVSIDEIGKAYYVVLAGGATAPSVTQVVAGQDGTGVAALKAGNINITTASTEFTANISGLTAGTIYDVYVVAQDVEITPNVQVTVTAIANVATTGSKPEPTSQATGLGVVINSQTALTLNWTDATGTQLPDGYLILANTTGTFTDPADGTAQANDLDLSDGSAVANVAQGIQTKAFTGLVAGTKYYFAIYSYTNSGTAIDYLLTTPLTANASTPKLALTYPNGGETFYAGDNVTFLWNTTNMDAENVMLEAYVYHMGTSSWGWTTIIASTANDGSEAYTIPADAAYGVNYKIRITGVTNGITDESDAPFTIKAVTNNLVDLLSMPANTIVKYTGTATVTYARTARNQKYIQDASGAVLIDDQTTAPGYITDTYAVGDGITNVEGKISFYNGLTEFVPFATTGTKVTTGQPTITPVVKTMAELTMADQSKLIQVNGVTFTNPGTEGDASGNFASSKNYTISDGTSRDTVCQFRTAFSEADYISTAIPTVAKNIIALVTLYDKSNSTKTVMQIIARNAADFLVTGINDEFDSNLTVYPNPFTNKILFKGTDNVKHVIVTSITGQVLKNVAVGSDSSIDTQDLPQGMYIVTFTNDKGAKSTIKMIKQ